MVHDTCDGQNKTKTPRQKILAPHSFFMAIIVGLRPLRHVLRLLQIRSIVFVLHNVLLRRFLLMRVTQTPPLMLPLTTTKTNQPNKT